MKLLQGTDVRWCSREATELDAPSGTLRTDYKALRVEGSRAEGAMRCARLLERWRPHADAGRVRLLYVWDSDGSSALDWLEQSADDMAEGNVREWEALKKRERERVESEGTFGLVGQFRTSDAEDWEDADSVWGFVGEDGLDVGGYAADAMDTALDKLAEALVDCCTCCGRPKVA